MLNKIQNGCVIEYTNSTEDAIASGDLVVIGSFKGVAVTDIPVGESGSVDMEGVFELKKVAPLVINQGDGLFWDADEKQVTKTTSDIALGTAFEDALSAATVVRVKLTTGDNSNIPVAASVSVLGTTSALVGVDGTGNNAAPLAGTEARLDAIEVKLDAIIASLKGAGLMA